MGTSAGVLFEKICLKRQGLTNVSVTFVKPACGQSFRGTWSLHAYRFSAFYWALGSG